MSDGVSFPAIAAISLLGIVWLAMYLYGLYRLARLFGRRFRSRRHPRAPYAAIVIGAVVVASAAAALPLDPFTKFCLALVVFATHAHPFLVGFWIADDAARREDRRIWSERTEEWLSEWEHAPRD